LRVSTEAAPSESTEVLAAAAFRDCLHFSSIALRSTTPVLVVLPMLLFPTA
jgi:hypothetical protein